MMLVIDNYDSFTWNLVQVMGDRGIACEVRRNDALTAAEALAFPAEGIVLSPGPCDPGRAGICLEVVRLAAEAGRPLLGVCLGHQAIGQAFGGAVVRAPLPMHGKVGTMRHQGGSVLRGLPDPFRATRYHSLVVDRASLPRSLAVTAESEDGLVMGLAHETLPIHGVQFHPESIASEHGATMLGNFAALAQAAARPA